MRLEKHCYCPVTRYSDFYFEGNFVIPVLSAGSSLRSRGGIRNEGMRPVLWSHGETCWIFPSLSWFIAGKFSFFKFTAVVIPYLMMKNMFSFIFYVVVFFPQHFLIETMASEDQKFSLQEVLDTFKLCLSENKEVYIEHYVAGWRGLIK